MPFKNEIELLHQQIERWKNEIEKSLKSLTDKNLIPLLNDVFYDVLDQVEGFSATNKIIKTTFGSGFEDILQQHNRVTNLEYLSDLAQRFKYVFMNSLAIHVKKGTVVDTEVAINTRTETIRDIKLFFNTNKTISRNYQDILDLSKLPNIELREEANNEIGHLLYALWQHPLFQFNDPIYPIGPIDHSAQDVINENYSDVEFFAEIHAMTIKELQKHYQKTSGYPTIKTREVSAWAKNNKKEAAAIFYRLEELSRQIPKVEDWIKGTGYTARLYNGINQALKIKPKD